ncbi:MAG: class II aldolase/adducin family protein, partial [Chloroflexi bacterium]|nr:class II aldolase/adducin family protein [Chloroflexota bacterium]
MTNRVAEVSQLRGQMLKASQAIVRAGAISRSGHGNMSIHVPGTDTMLLTSVSNLDGLTADALPLVSFDGKVLDGHLEATSAEIVGMHGVVYERNAQMGAVVHTHAPYATSFAVANQ